MKIIIALLILASQSTFACNNFEALIVAKITEIKTISTGTCLVSVGDFSYFREHALCPLDMSEILNSGITLEGINCEKSIGDSIDGVVISNGLKIVLD
ncbi:hypothetical protein A9Q84_00790 [Halobacteriovorax marinus]|uniref:Lipoprotein n=1 Tax=Halobacteriovorax marinus TaxID=97084 RepID=A0A1Y5FBZ0_9BACT|nr:hypothetical protein A9Q84_00790 [Halobacteriovorax marinus]